MPSKVGREGSTLNYPAIVEAHCLFDALLEGEFYGVNGEWNDFGDDLRFFRREFA
jgi:hypothetical protein